MLYSPHSNIIQSRLRKRGFRPEFLVRLGISRQALLTWFILSKELYQVFLKGLSLKASGCGGTGRHARLRGVWRKPCEFESRHPHNIMLTFTGIEGSL